MACFNTCLSLQMFCAYSKKSDWPLLATASIARSPLLFSWILHDAYEVSSACVDFLFTGVLVGAHLILSICLLMHVQQSLTRTTTFQGFAKHTRHKMHPSGPPETRRSGCSDMPMRECGDVELYYILVLASAMLVSVHPLAFVSVMGRSTAVTCVCMCMSVSVRVCVCVSAHGQSGTCRLVCQVAYMRRYPSSTLLCILFKIVSTANKALRCMACLLHSIHCDALSLMSAASQNAHFCLTSVQQIAATRQ